MFICGIVAFSAIATFILAAMLANVPNQKGLFRGLIGGVGAMVILGYLGWSFLGLELPAPAKESLPIIRPSTTSSSSTSGGGYFGRGSSGYSSGGWSFGK